MIEPITNRLVDVAVQGCGQWTQRAIRPDLAKLNEALLDDGLPGLRVTYIDTQFTSPVPLSGEDRYWCLLDDDTRENLAHQAFDVVIIATPDFAHIDNVREWRTRSTTAKFILVEKPFSDSSYEVGQLLAEMAGDARHTPEAEQFVRGFDHYVLYASDIIEHGTAIDEFLGSIEALKFSMTETQPIEAERLRTLQSGIIFDMGAHFLALAVVVIGSEALANFDVIWRGVHLFDGIDDLHGRMYFAETGAELTFDGLPPGGGPSTSFYGRVGKALDSDAKYVCLLGTGDTAAN